MNKEMYNEKIKIFKTIAIVILALGLLAGILCGNAYPAIAERNVGTSSYPITKTVEVFNFGLMFAVWLGSAGAAGVPLSIYCILDSMLDILVESKRINQNLNNKAEGILTELQKANFYHQSSVDKKE